MTTLNTEENRSRLRRALRETNSLVLEDIQPNPEAFEFDEQAGAELCFVPGSDATGLLASADLQYRGTDAETARLFENAEVDRGWQRLARMQTQNPSVVLQETERLLELRDGRSSNRAPEEDSETEEELVVPDDELRKEDRNGQRFGTDLVRVAREDELREVVGREEELQALLRVVSKRGKNAACLVGEAGVGKTAIVEKLATYVAENQVPDRVEISQLLSVNLGFVAAGATAKNQFEGRFKKILDTARENPRVVLFLDEVHMLRGKNDVSQMVKEDLGRGTIRLIGATTPKEYRAIEDDPALKRRFQKIPVPEPSREESVEILRGVKEEIEAHHDVDVPEELLEDIVALSDRFVPDRQLPDKAIDLLDEAAARRGLSAEQTLLLPPPDEPTEDENEGRGPRSEGDESRDEDNFNELVTQDG